MIEFKLGEFKYNSDVILKDFEIDFESGKTHGIIGLNGAGKTTFFQLLAGFLKSEKCLVLRKGQGLTRKQVAYLDTDLFFYSKLTAKEFLSVFPAPNLAYNEVKLAELFNIPLSGFMEEFSTGMKKKLLLLSQIKQDKEIYILDEPFNGLDLETNKILEVIITVLNERGKTVFISSHILAPLLHVCEKIHHIKHQTLFKSYKKEEFKLIEEELFGTYTRNLKSELMTIF